MKIIVVSCNYNAAVHLENTIENLKKNVRELTYFTIVDNCSKDNSVEIIDKHASNFLCIQKLSSNVGKAVALNNLVKTIDKESFPISDEDLILSLDSDISLIADDFFDRARQIWNLINNKVCCMVCFQVGNSLFKRQMNFIDSEKGQFSYFADPMKTGSGIAGGSIFVPYKYWKEINGYRENMGANGKAALYGGMDGWLMYDLAKATSLPVCVIKNLEVFHPVEQDDKYQKWKDQLHREHLMYGHSITTESYR